jgi:hypothetical protein
MSDTISALLTRLTDKDGLVRKRARDETSGQSKDF